LSAEAKRWFSPAELADLNLSGLPSTKAGMHKRIAAEDWQRPAWEGQRWRARADRGGGVEYHLSVLPMMLQAQVLARYPEAAPDDAAVAEMDKTLEARWQQAGEAHREEAGRRLAVLLDWRDLQQRKPRVVAAYAVMQAHAIKSIQTLYAWERMVDGVPEAMWRKALLPLSKASAQPKEIEPAAWDMLRADWLRPERPSFEACFRRLQAAAAANGWMLPSPRTLRRRLDGIKRTTRVLAREGREALMAMLPPQQRDRGVFHALEAVNADGHKWDVFVKWPGVEKPVRPVMIAFQDLYSGKILSWRFDRSENRHAVRLAFADLVETYGIPSACWLDNGRNFASKWLTGGTPTRYRFKVRDDEPQGILPLLGVRVHWTTPYSGQSKPIERAFRDMAGDVAKHPAFAGAYTGNKPDAKPENYMSTAVPLDVFIATVDAEIAAHNARVGRRSTVCHGRSFDEAFAASYATAPIRKARRSDINLLLLAAEQIKTRADNAIHFMGNRFFADFLLEHRGRPLTVRFDPDDLHDGGLHVYRADGPYLGHAPCIAAVGFNDTEAGRDLARRKKTFLRAQREQLDAERALSLKQFVEMLPKTEAATPPEARVVRPMFGGAAAALKPMQEEQTQTEIEVMAAIRRMTAGRLHVVQPEGSDD
jgi:transposase InsO family protein